MLFQKILLPTDLSTEGERAFQAVSELARGTGATVVLLHVVENVGAPPVGQTFPAPSLLPGTKQELEKARAGLAERRAKFPAGVEVVTEALVAPSVPHAIVDFAGKNGCDVVALSTHGRSGFRRLIVGSVAEAVLRSSRVPVLVFPRQG
jgi:nucleotide-binding universal stress UspA family protein